MNSRRDVRGGRMGIFDGNEEEGIRASSSLEISETEDDAELGGLEERVGVLKRGNGIDSSRGVLFGTVDKFKMVFETKSTRRMSTLFASFLLVFLVVYLLSK